MARSRKNPKPKLPTHERIERKSDPRGVYAVLDSLVKAHRPDLIGAKIACAWRFGWKRNKDGQVILGKCKKAGDLDKQFHDMDFVIILNFEAWTEKLTPDQRTALMHHELEHAAISEDQNGNPKKDARGRQMYRVRKHDLEEFRSIVKEYGCYKSDIEDFVRTAMTGKKPPQPTLPMFDIATAAPKIEDRLRGMGHDVTVTASNGTPKAGAVAADVPTWRAMSLNAAFELHDLEDLTTLKNLGVKTCGELADRIVAGNVFGLTNVDQVRTAIEEISSDDPEPIRFDKPASIPSPSTNGYHHTNGIPSANGKGGKKPKAKPKATAK